MFRMQVSFEKAEYNLAKKEADALCISFAEFVRGAVHQSLQTGSERPWMKYVGFISSGDPNSSQSIDEIVYGAKQDA